MVNKILIFVLFGLSSCQNYCNNPDCSFSQLKTPITLYSKSFNQITVVDANGKMWSSSTNWHIAKEILVEGYQIGDTIGKRKF